jgi:tetratricopeptide (TPR) repeat protein
MIDQTLIGLLVQANELRRQGDYSAALALYLELLDRFRESTNLLANLLAEIASCYNALNRFDEAVAWVERAIALAPNDARWHADLAEYHWLGTLDYEQAAREFRKAIELNPNDARVLSNAAALYIVPEGVVTLEEAINWLERAVQLEPNNPRYHARLGEYYYKAGQIEDAKRAWVISLLCGPPLEPGYAQMIEVTLGTDSDQILSRAR